jgi:hypothetical protein
MRSNRQLSHEEVKPTRSSFRWDLYYYERVGAEYYLRITPFAIILIVVALVIGFTMLFMDGYQSQRKIDVNVKTLYAPTASPTKSDVTPALSPTKLPPSKRSK